MENSYQNNNSNTILLVIISVLLILIAVLGTLYFTSNKNNNNNNNSNHNQSQDKDNNQEEKPSTPTIPTEKTEKNLSDEELNKYLSYVPMLIEYDSEREGALNSNYGYKLDAYTGKSVTVTDLDERLLLAIAYNMTEEESEIREAGKYSWCGLNSTCTGDKYVLIEKLNSTLKKLYNIDSANDKAGAKFRILGGIVEKSDKYYVKFSSTGGTSLTKGISKIKAYNVKGDTLTIYEQAGFEGSVLSSSKALRYTNEENDEKYDFRYNKDTKETITKYFEDNIDKFAIFKHTFKLGASNEYYYYATEEFK